MGQAELEEETPSSHDPINNHQQDWTVDVPQTLPSDGGGGGAFFVKVEEVTQPKQQQRQLRPKAPTPDSGTERSRWLTRPRRGFSLFNFKRKGHDTKATTSRETNGQTAREGKAQQVLPQLHPQPSTLTDVEVQVLSQSRSQSLGALIDFEDGDTGGTKLFQPAAKAVEVAAMGSVLPMSPSTHLASDPAVEDEVSLKLQEITTLYSILNPSEKGQGDFTSVSFELEEFDNKNENDIILLQGNENTDILQGNTTNNNNQSQPNSQETHGLSQALRPLTINGGRPPTRDGNALFVTSDRGPTQILNVAEKSQAIRVRKPDLENWMSNLPPSLQRLPLNHIYIPGSHDSFSYSLSPSGEIGPDAPQVVTSLSRVCPALVRPALLRWSVTQKATVAEQLAHGVRYFDIRVASKDSKFYFVHGLYGGDLQFLLSQIQSFLSSHPGEVVLLDFQHFHGLTTYDHTSLKSLLRQIFRTTLAPIMHSPTLAYLARYKYQVLLFYRDHAANSGVSWLWPSGYLPNPWPDTTSVTEMLHFLEEHLELRNTHKFFVTQCVLTPSTGYVARHVFSSLKTMATRTNRALPEWVKGLEDGPPGANIIMADFVEQNDWILPSSIVAKNYEYQSLVT